MVPRRETRTVHQGPLASISFCTLFNMSTNKIEITGCVPSVTYPGTSTVDTYGRIYSYWPTTCIEQIHVFACEHMAVCKCGQARREVRCQCNNLLNV